MKAIKEELEKISQMNKDQKWDYFKSYYLVKAIFAFIGLILFIWFVKDTFFQKEIVSAGCIYGVELTDEEKHVLTDGYLEYYRLNPKKYGAYISTDNMFEGTAQQMDANAHEMALFAQIAAGEVYYLILDEESLNLMANGGIYNPLDELFPNGLPFELNNCAINLKDSESGKQYAAAIDLKKAGIFTDGKEGYLVFTVGIPDEEYPKRLLEYLKNR